MATEGIMEGRKQHIKITIKIALALTVFFMFVFTEAKAEDYANLVEKVMPSIVMIKTDTGTGSGFFVNSEGDVLTNYHVVDGARYITVTLQKGNSLKASLKSYDAKKDMALLAVKTPYPINFLKVSTKLPRQGETVIAISNPRGLSGTVTNGIVSAFRNNNSWLQFTAPVSPGSSGGALLNLKGEIVGMITANLKGEGQNLNFAISSAVLAKFLTEAGKNDAFLLARNGTPEQLKKARKKGVIFNVSRKFYDFETDEEHYTEEFDFGETPLHLAAMHNRNAESIRFLISQGLDVNAEAGSGNTVMETPLSCAVKKRNINAVKELLKAGADPHIWSTGNNSSMFHIVASEYRNRSEAKTVIAELVKAGGNVNFHHEFTQEEINDWCNYEQLENFRIEWSIDDPLGGPSNNLSHAARGNFLSSFTPLMYAVLYDNPDIVNILLDAKADPNIHNMEGKTALDYAMLLPEWTNIRRSSAFRRLKALTSSRSAK
ncbi:MAG: trypsin-like peptidase domain-containing protein [Synergistaceae bacterium]|nr:trypsin-like peptidase domain-containing protein [Synergistaceae bacterium]